MSHCFRFRSFPANLCCAILSLLLSAFAPVVMAQTDGPAAQLIGHTYRFAPYDPSPQQTQLAALQADSDYANSPEGAKVIRDLSNQLAAIQDWQTVIEKGVWLRFLDGKSVDIIHEDVAVPFRLSYPFILDSSGNQAWKILRLAGNRLWIEATGFGELQLERVLD